MHYVLCGFDVTLKMTLHCNLFVAPLSSLLQDLVDEIVAFKAKRKQSEFDQSEKELKIRSALIEAERIEVKKKVGLGRKFLAEEEAVAKRYAKKEGLKTAAERVSSMLVFRIVKMCLSSRWPKSPATILLCRRCRL
jgi:hypothetical protein